MATQELTGALDDAGVPYELLAHEHTTSATDEAEALGLSPDEVAKTLVLTTPDGYLRTVVPASRRIDFRKLADLEGAGRKRRCYQVLPPAPSRRCKRPRTVLAYEE